MTVRSYTILEMLGAVRRLPAQMPESDTLPTGGYQTHQQHWVTWLSEYDGPGGYGRNSWDVDARSVYARLCNAYMIVYLNEAAGADPAAIRQTIREIFAKGNNRAQTEAKIARERHPWDGLTKLLFR
ncbi:hypothetical protein HAP48_0043005 [Bradyrhizobium septentrionale]|uniref:Uncharacterized protein n=1 Tax=Bradyrhizobium septentrionale TaxID=1404411 RepID=A0A973W2N1_9BRAD|nr:hypothetical protein [Bradyrhizobium septentrionale]UGY15228.1 hypothetical protein HAP48_0043005 [Bradyrhizobium septentrionale]